MIPINVNSYKLLAFFLILTTFFDGIRGFRHQLTRRTVGSSIVYAKNRPNGDIENNMGYRRPKVDARKANVPLSKNVVAGKEKISDRSTDYKSIIMYNEDQIKPWSFADSFNSTTLRLLFEIKDDISSAWAKIEQAFASWVLIVSSKVERDVRTTTRAGDYISRRISKDTSRILGGVSEVARPVLELPSTISQLSNRNDSWSLILAGVNPLESSRMIGNLDATSTRKRAKVPKKRSSPLSADSLYRSVRLLPQTLQYDYERRRVAQELSKTGGVPYSRMLSDGSSSRIHNTDQEGDERDEAESAASETGTTPKLVRPQLAAPSSSLRNDKDLISGSVADSAQSPVSSVLKDLCAMAAKGDFDAMLGEFRWAREVAQETLAVGKIELQAMIAASSIGNTVSDNVATETGKKGDLKELVGENKDVNNSAVSEQQQLREAELDFLQWNLDRVVEAVNRLTAAEESCDRLKSLAGLPTQLSMVRRAAAQRQREHFMRMKAKGKKARPLSRAQLMEGLSVSVALRSGDVVAVCKGIEVLVEAVAATSTAEAVGKKKVGWSAGQENVFDRVVSRRPLLVEVYGRLQGREDELEEQRVRQRVEGERAEQRRQKKMRRRQQKLKLKLNENEDEGKETRQWKDINVEVEVGKVVSVDALDAKTGVDFDSKMSTYAVTADADFAHENELENENERTKFVTSDELLMVSESATTSPIDENKDHVDILSGTLTSIESDQQDGKYNTPSSVQTTASWTPGALVSPVLTAEEEEDNEYTAPPLTLTHSQALSDELEDVPLDPAIAIAIATNTVNTGGQAMGGVRKEREAGVTRVGEGSVISDESESVEAKKKQFGDVLRQLLFGDNKSAVNTTEGEAREDNMTTISLSSVKITNDLDSETLKHASMSNPSYGIDPIQPLGTTESFDEEGKENVDRDMTIGSKDGHEVFTSVMEDDNYMMVQQEEAETAVPTSTWVKNIVGEDDIGLVMESELEAQKEDAVGRVRDDVAVEGALGVFSQESSFSELSTNGTKNMNGGDSFVVGNVKDDDSWKSAGEDDSEDEYEDDDDEDWLYGFGESEWDDWDEDDDEEEEDYVLEQAKDIIGREDGDVVGDMSVDVDDMAVEEIEIASGALGSNEDEYFDDGLADLEIDFEGFVLLTEDAQATTWPSVDTTRFSSSEWSQQSIGAEKVHDTASSSSATSTVVDTTAESAVSDSEKAVKLLLTSIDVTLFLLETMVRVVGPLVKDGGQVALQRASEALLEPRISPKTLATRSKALRRQIRTERGEGVGSQPAAATVKEKKMSVRVKPALEKETDTFAAKDKETNIVSMKASESDEGSTSHDNTINGEWEPLVHFTRQSNGDKKKKNQLVDQDSRDA